MRGVFAFVFALIILTSGFIIGLNEYQYKLTPDIYDKQYSLCSSNEGLTHIHIQRNETHTVCNNGAVFVIENNDAK